MAQTKTYYYCDGYNLENVVVTMNVGTCGNMTEYNDGYNIYRTYTVNITFTLSHAVPVDLYPRFSYLYEQWIDYELTYSGTHNTLVEIPAGETFFNLEFTCREERWTTNDNYDDGLRIPTIN